VFAHYRDTLDAISAALTQAGIPFVRVDGDTSAQNRVAAEDTFTKGGARIFLGQMVAASVSMNLQTAYISVTFDHDWKAYNYEQSLARTCRRGQTRDCHHFDLVANKLQRTVVQRLRTAMDFNAEAADWQDLKLGIARSTPGVQS
jgi:SNF2 family DNA or RNA helicase